MVEEIEELLKTLRCHGMLGNFREMIETAKEKQTPWLETFQQLLEVEAEYRKTRSFMYRLKLAKLPHIKTIEHFDTSEMPLEKKTLDDLTQCQYIQSAENILLIGSSGSGKSHIALALAHVALQQNYRVKFYKFNDLARRLLQAKDHHYEANFIERLSRFHLIVVDEVGYLPVDKQAGALLFELFSTLYEKVSVIIVTHLSFNEWGDLFGNAKATKAIIDRLTHHCQILETGHVSWRLKESTQQENGNKQ